MKAFYSVAALVFVALAALTAGSRASQSAPPAAAPVIIHMHDFMFDPSTVTIAPGGTVEWDNDDGARHTITASDKSFDSGDLKPGQKWSHVFPTAGTFSYACTQHPEMTAEVIVK